MKKMEFLRKLHMERVVAGILAAALFFTSVPVYGEAAEPQQEVIGEEVSQEEVTPDAPSEAAPEGTSEASSEAASEGTSETSSESASGSTSETSSEGAAAELSSEEQEKIYGAGLKRSKYGKLYYDYVAEGNVIPATTLFIGTYLIDARAINASVEDQVTAASEEAGRTASGSTDVKKGISNVIYQKALQSQQTYNQKTRFYRSELADGEWRDISAAGKLQDILKTARTVPKSELDPLLITCVVGADGIPRDPDGQEMNIFDYPDPYEMEEITELRPIQEYYDSGRISENSTGSDNYRYWRLYYFFNHDNIPTFDRYSTSQLLVDRTFRSLGVDDSGKNLEEAWDEAEVRNEIPDDENRSFKETVRNWPNARDSVTNIADRGIDTTYKLYLSLKKQEIDEEAAEALRIAESLDAERRAEVFYNLTKNTNILLNSRMKEIDNSAEDLDAEISALTAEAEEIRTVELPDLERSHDEMEEELRRSLEAAEKAEAEIAAAAAEREKEEAAAAAEAEGQEEAAGEGEAAAEGEAVEEGEAAAEGEAAGAGEAAAEGEAAGEGEAVAEGEAEGEGDAGTETTSAAESEEAAAEEEAKDLTKLETMYERLSRYTIFKGKLEKELEKLSRENALAPVALETAETLGGIEELSKTTIPDLGRKIENGNAQIKRLEEEKKELEETLKDAQERERFTLEKTLKNRISENENMTKAYRDAIAEAEKQQSEARTLLSEKRNTLRTNLSRMDAMNADEEEAEVRTLLKELSDGLSAALEGGSEEAAAAWEEKYVQAKAAASALQEKKSDKISAKEEEIKAVDGAIESVKTAIESRKTALAAEVTANEKQQEFVRERLATIEDQIRYKKEAAEERKKEGDFLSTGMNSAAEKAEKAAEVADLKAERSKLEREKKLRQAELPPLESDYTTAKAELDKVAAEKAELENQLATLNSELAALSSGKESLLNRDKAIDEEIPALTEEKSTHPAAAYENDPIYQQLEKEKASLETQKKEAETTGIRDARLNDFNRWEPKEAAEEKRIYEAIKAREKAALSPSGSEAVTESETASESEAASGSEAASESEAVSETEAEEGNEALLQPLRDMYEKDLKEKTRESFEKLLTLLENAAVTAAAFEEEGALSPTRLSSRRNMEAAAEELERQRENAVVSTRRQIQRGAAALSEPGDEEKAMHAQIEELTASLNDTEERLNTESARIAEEIEAWQALQDQKIASLREEKRRISEDLVQNTTDTSAKEAEITSKEAEIQRKEDEVKPYQDTSDEKQSLMEAKEKEISDIDIRLRNIDEEIAKKQAEYEAIDADVNAEITNAEFSIGPTLEFLKLLSETGSSDQGRTYGNMSAYRGEEYIEDATLTAAIGEGIMNSNASYVTYRDKTINRGEQVYENLRYQYSRRVIDAGIDETEAMPHLTMLVDLGNVYYNEEVVHKERELAVIDETLLPMCLGRLEAVKEPKNSLSDYDLNRDIEEYQSYISARTDRDSVNNSITFVKRRITYAENLKKTAKEWSTARIDEHIEWLNRLLASLNSDIDDSDAEFEEIDEYIQKLKEEEQKKLEEDDPKTAKKLSELRKAEEQKKDEMISSAIDPNLPVADQLDKLNRIGGKPKVEDYLKERILGDIGEDDYNIDDDLNDLSGIGGDIGPIIEGLNQKGAPEEVINKAKQADITSRENPLYGYNNTPPDPGSGNRGSGSNGGEVASGGTDTGGAGGSGTGNTPGGGGGRGEGVGKDRGALGGNDIDGAIQDTFGGPASALSDADKAAALAALSKYGIEYGDNAVLAYARALLEEILGKGNVNGFIYRQYMADQSAEYVSFGSIDMTRAHSHYRYTHREQNAVLQQVYGGSASYSFEIGNDVMRDNKGEEHPLSTAAVSQADTYLHNNSDTLYPYIAEQDAIQYLEIECAYVPGEDWAVLIPPVLKPKMAELEEKLSEMARALNGAI